MKMKNEKNEKVKNFEKNEKMNKVKEEKGFLRREVMQVTLPGYLLGLLVAERCLCS